MGLFKAKKNTSTAIPLHEESNEGSTPTTSKKKKFPFLKQRNTKQSQHAAVDTAVTKACKNKLPTEQTAVASSTKKNVQRQEERGDTPLHDVHNSEELPEDIPRSISTPSRDENSLLPPLPATPNDDDKDTDGNDGRVGEEDSLGSPCESMLRLQKKQQQKEQQDVNNIMSAPKLNAFHRETNIQKLSTIISNDALNNTPTIDHLSCYIMALSSSISPNSSGDLPSKALRCLFTLSELREDTTNKLQRVDMVKPQDSKNSGGKEEEISLVPALLSFLQRCPRDSSEQYLTLLVLNNLSIPVQNKRIIALQYNGISILSKLLCHDPGCHLLVIIIVNLTFGDEMLNRDLLNTSSENENGEQEKKEEEEGGDEGVHLVNSLSYALLLASLTSEELAKLGAIPLTSPEGIPYSSRKLLSLLFSLLESELGIQYGANKNVMLELPPLSLVSLENKKEKNEPCYPFAETVRWCLGALKNLTRPSKLAPSSSITGKGNTSSSAVATQAILEAGILPLLLRILNSKSYDNTGTIYSWETNSAQDAALYTFLHMTSLPQYRQVLMGDDDDYGCVEVLTSILRYGKVVIGERSLVKDDDGKSLCQLNLQCMKARLALSYLVLGCSENSSSSNVISKYGSATILAEYEAHSIIELLAHCLQGRAKEGPGGYSASTYALKSVLYGIKCILCQPANQKLFAVTGNASRLNALLLKSVSCYSLLDMVDMMDAEATEHAVVSIQQMTLNGMDEDELGYSVPDGHCIFLPDSFGDNENAQSVVAKILRSYLTNFEDGYTIKGRHAVNQILFRLNYLRFEGSVAGLTYPAGKTFPSKSDFDVDKKVLKVLSMIKTQDGEEKGAKPQEHIFNRSIARHEKHGDNSKVYSNALEAAEDLAISIALSAQEQYPQEPLDTVAVANNITYYADGEDLYYNYSWTWGDGHGDTIERIYSAAETEDQMLLQPEQGEVNDAKDQSEPYTLPKKGIFGTRFNLPFRITTVADENEPFTIFGLRCAAPMCGGKKEGSVL